MITKKKQMFMQKPIERHDTASWADIEQLEPETGVIIPKESGVINAKEYVDQNQK
ncbi:CDIF630_02480 family spore surface protein [Thermoclostridium stercorarium]|uniref:CDIF630_02480 family spore surface protein n=1 Tax=Thermoclostridium stercorarium TaxID=1510 RepID=UPI000A8AC424